MREDLKALWDKAGETGEPQALGRIVVCDVCSVDYTDDPASGGFLFGSYAYCPPCAVKAWPAIEKYAEQHFIKARCPDGQSFADFVRALRGPDAQIRVTHLKPEDLR